MLGMRGVELADRLTVLCSREIVVRGSRGGDWNRWPLSSTMTQNHLQGQRLSGLVGQLVGEVRDTLTMLDTTRLAEVRVSLPPDAAAFTGREDELTRITAVAMQGGCGRRGGGDLP